MQLRAWWVVAVALLVGAGQASALGLNLPLLSNGAPLESAPAPDAGLVPAVLEAAEEALAPASGVASISSAPDPRLAPDAAVPDAAPLSVPALAPPGVPDVAPLQLPRLIDLPQLAPVANLANASDLGDDHASPGVAGGARSVVPAPSGRGAPPAPSAPSLGSQTIGADMRASPGLGEEFGAWASQFFGGAAGVMGALPPGVGAALLGAVALILSGLLTAGAYLGGFRHLEKESLLEHTFRSQVLHLIREEPGVHLREIARRLGLTTTNASYHLRVLEKHGLLRSERLNGKRVYFPAAGPGQRQKFLAQALMLRDTRAQVVHALAAHPDSNQTALAALTGQHQGAVSWHLRQLAAAGLVYEERTPRECRYRLSTLGVELAQAKPRVLLQPVAEEAPQVEPVPVPLTA